MPAASLSDEGTYAFWSDQADLKGPQHDLTSGFLCSFLVEVHSIIRSAVIANSINNDLKRQWPAYAAEMTGATEPIHSYKMI